MKVYHPLTGKTSDVPKDSIFMNARQCGRTMSFTHWMLTGEMPQFPVSVSLDEIYGEENMERVLFIQDAGIALEPTDKDVTEEYLSSHPELLLSSMGTNQRIVEKDAISLPNPLPYAVITGDPVTDRRRRRMTKRAQS